MSDVVLPLPEPTTEKGEAKKKAATRKSNINMLWEYTQAFLAISLVLASIYTAISGTNPESETLKNALFVVIGFYFGRTNHARPVLPVTEEEGEVA